MASLSVTPSSGTVNGSNGITFVIRSDTTIDWWGIDNYSAPSGSNHYFNNSDWGSRHGTVSADQKQWTITMPRSALVSGSNEFYVEAQPVSGNYLYLTIYLTVQFASLGKPGNPTISQAKSSRKITAKWTAASASGGSGSVTYDLVSGDEGEVIWHGTSVSTSEIAPLS